MKIVRRAVLDWFIANYDIDDALDPEYECIEIYEMDQVWFDASDVWVTLGDDGLELSIGFSTDAHGIINRYFSYATSGLYDKIRCAMNELREIIKDGTLQTLKSQKIHVRPSEAGMSPEAPRGS